MRSCTPISRTGRRRADYDAVVSFNAFHWVDPARRYELAARLLRPGGSFAFVEPVTSSRPESDPFFLEMQEDYRAVGLAGDEPPGSRRMSPTAESEFDASGLFEDVLVRRHLLTRDYTADEYIDVDGNVLGPPAAAGPVREELFRLKRRRIEARPGRLRAR